MAREVGESLGISARHRARLRKEVLLAGEDWPYDPARKEMRTKRNGHKCDRISAEKRANTAELMQKMPQIDEPTIGGERIAASLTSWFSRERKKRERNCFRPPRCYAVKARLPAGCPPERKEYRPKSYSSDTM
ncbi:hypothetical protein CsSME_00019578 [Camellia sinensis var. sinensis]